VSPDNTKAIIHTADALEPRLVDAFLEYAQAGDFHVDPTRVRHPKDKARVERAVPGVRVDAQNAPTAACKTRRRVSHSSHNASSFPCTRSTRRDDHCARTPGGTHATASTTVATLRRVNTMAGICTVRQEPDPIPRLDRTPPTEAR